MKKAFIIGNGKSRENFDLEKIKEKGKTFGCNAIYRDFYPDYLIAIDDDMVDEVYKSNFPSHKVLVPVRNERFELNGSGRRSNADMNAMYEAIKRGYNELFCLGFDFIIDDNRALSNVYDGTDCYGPETRASMNDNIHRVGYMEWFAGQNADTTFVFVLPRDVKKIRDISAVNVYGMYVDQFENEVF